jgi:hypothetical protein
LAPECRYGGPGATPSTFTGVIEGRQIESTILNATFNSVGPSIGGTTARERVRRTLPGRNCAYPQIALILEESRRPLDELLALYPFLATSN